jgi:acyl-coenzyme A synthetase/AMP-(fatty) acid ligase
MEAERVTSVFLVPAQWHLLCEDASLGSRDLSTVLHIVDALPRNASGKVMKTALRREYR